AHFPGFTLARSAYREFRLLRDKKTSWDRSLKHMVVDTGGALAAAQAGALTGLAVGSIVPGPGHVIGPVLFTALAVITAKTATNKLKNGPLKKAEREFTESLQQYETAMKSSIHSTVQKLKEEARKQERLLSQQIRPIPHCSRQLRDHLAAMGERSLEEVKVYLQHAKEIIRELEVYTENQWYWRAVGYLIPEYVQLLQSKATVTEIIGYTQSFLPKEDMVSQHPAEAIKQLSLVPLPISSLRDNL